MKALQFINRDKDKLYGPGPWSNEFDKYQWLDEETQYPCLIVRNQLGALCGYVGVNKNNPLYKSKFIHTEKDDVYIHGGITYTAHCEENGYIAESICHIPEPNDADENLWWFGFDCAHGGDYAPKIHKGLLGNLSAYRTVTYVKSEIKLLATYLKKLEIDNRIRACSSVG